MNYQKIHSQIINNAKDRNWNKKIGFYVECHHIIPRSFGGKNTKENIVVLTPKEHYIVHLLLTKIYTGFKREKMVRAFMRMCKGNDPVRRIVTSRTYSKLREEYSKIVSRQVSGKNHPFYGKKHSEETKQKMSQLRKERILCGSQEGHRIPHTDVSKKKMSLSSKGFKHTENTKRKISQSQNEILKRGLKKIGKVFLIEYIDGHNEEIRNLSNFCKKNNFKESTIRSRLQMKNFPYKDISCITPIRW